jgi:tetratricopeptide (TPR) repeat protein
MHKSEDGRLFVRTAPEGARIRILNIKPKFHQGILLKRGPYQIEVSADGYETRIIWITMEPGEEMNLAISLKKHSSTLSGIPDEWVLLGIDHQKRKEHKQAIEAYRKALRMDPNYVEAHYNLGYGYSKLGLHREAIEAYKQAIRIQPDAANTHYNLGISYSKLGLHKEAIEAYTLAIPIQHDAGDDRHRQGFWGKP